MPFIAIIDDDPEQSSTLLNNIEIAIEEFGSDLEIIARLPFKDPNDYFTFINEKDVCVLILDEKLSNLPVDENGPVDYKGSELVSLLRKGLKEFPIFSITNYASVEELNAKYSEFEEIIKKSDFIEDTNKYFPKILRAAKNFLKDNYEELSEFNNLTKEISGGNQDPELIKKLQALQVKLDMPLVGFENRSNWLAEYENHIQELEKLNQKIRSKINKKE